MLIDEVTILAQAGHGGPGSVSFFPMRQGPCGGDGGMGGNVVVVADRFVKNLNAVAKTKEYNADDGAPGENFNKDGAFGKNCVIRVPLHTEVTNLKTKAKISIDTYDKEYTICFGGAGGRGNDAFKSATNQAPKYAEPGVAGERAEFLFVLKLIADIGLIGLPNAGKSSLLNELTHAGARTAAYPFTTLEPNLGACGEKIIADIPGLIEGASYGKGLGFKFLKHVEKVKVLFHCVSVENENIAEVYNTIRAEMIKYNDELGKKPEFVLLTKMDLVPPEQRAKKVQEVAIQLGKEVLPMSMHDPDAIEKLKEYVLHLQ